MNKQFIIDLPYANTDESLPAAKIIGVLATASDTTTLTLEFKALADESGDEIEAVDADVDDGVVTITFGTGE